MEYVKALFQFVGSLAFLLYGMKLMSDGIQKSAGQSLHRTLGLMTGNRVLATLTGMLITMIIQSSGATTVMVVTFVNAGLITLKQSVGVIFGANIGTTITAWIVTIFGFKFNMAAFAIPLFGIGYILTIIKKIRKQNLGEAIMGFGLLFLGLDWLSKALTFTPEQVSFLTYFSNESFIGYLVAIVTGTVVTMLLHSSSAASAIVLTMCNQGLMTWKFAAVVLLGSNIGSTIDAVLAAVGTKVDARRSALVHVLFNVVGTLIALLFLDPLLHFVDLITPGAVEKNITFHISMFHTVTKVFETLIFLPFVEWIVKITEILIKPKEDETPSEYKLEFVSTMGKENIEAYIMRAEKEIVDMTKLTSKMFSKLEKGLTNKDLNYIEDYLSYMQQKESYADQMHEKLITYLIKCGQLPLSASQQNNISIMLRVVDEIENMTDDCYSIAFLVHRSVEKQMVFETEDLERLEPYMELVHNFLDFIIENLNKHLSEDKLRFAEIIEDQIDNYRSQLKKVARRRLESGANVKTELQYIDIVRHIEKIGDCAFSISEALSQTI